MPDAHVRRQAVGCRLPDGFALPAAVSEDGAVSALSNVADNAVAIRELRFRPVNDGFFGSFFGDYEEESAVRRVLALMACNYVLIEILQGRDAVVLSCRSDIRRPLSHGHQCPCLDSAECIPGRRKSCPLDAPWLSAFAS